MTEDDALQYIILIALVFLGTLIFYAGYSVAIGWICGVTGDSLIAC